MSVYAANVKNYFHGSDIAAGSAVTTLIDRPIVLKSIIANASFSVSPSPLGGFEINLFDGGSKIFVLSKNPAYGSFANRAAFDFPLSGIKINTSFGLNIIASGAFADLACSGLSFIYQD